LANRSIGGPGWKPRINDGSVGGLRAKRLLIDEVWVKVGAGILIIVKFTAQKL